MKTSGMLAAIVVVSLVVAARHSAEFAEAHEGSASAVKAAVCVVRPTKGNQCRGVVRFAAAAEGKVKVTAKISGLSPSQKHAIHIHAYGDTTDLSGKSAGGHYNPDNNPHGLPPAKKRHAGDLGNLMANAEGKAEFALTVDNISIAGKSAILGRAIVIHAKVDDGGQPTGNAGARIGFGVIGIANPGN